MKKYLYVTIAAGMAFVLVGLMAYQSRRIAGLENTLEDMHFSLLRQSAEEMSDLSLSMEKALLSSDAVHTAELMHAIGQTAGIVQQNLSLLPASQQMQPALALANRLSDYATRLLPLLWEQGQLTPEDRVLLQQHLALCSQLTSQLALADSAEDLSTLQLDLPAASADARAKGLPQGEITQEEAVDIARQFVGADRVTSAQAAPGTSGALAAYGVTVRTADLQLNLEITRQGGKVLWMMPETASFAVTQSPQSCQEAALTFLEWQGFAPMHPVHYQIYDGLCVISLAPLQEEVLLYPDLIRVQVRMDTAQVVGLEAHNYWLNHVQRDLPPPLVKPEDALARISAHARVENSRLCLIPVHGQETLCHEFTVTHEGETYLIYIDALSGQEAELLKTVAVENGSLTA